MALRALLTSVKCGCCKGYTDTVKSVLGEINIVDASSAVGKDLIKRYNIRGLPALIYDDEILEGKMNELFLKKHFSK